MKLTNEALAALLEQHLAGNTVDASSQFVQVSIQAENWPAHMHKLRYDEAL